MVKWSAVVACLWVVLNVSAGMALVVLIRWERGHGGQGVPHHLMTSTQSPGLVIQPRVTITVKPKPRKPKIYGGRTHRSCKAGRQYSATSPNTLPPSLRTTSIEPANAGSCSSTPRLRLWGNTSRSTARSSHALSGANPIVALLDQVDTRKLTLIAKLVKDVVET